MPFKLRNIPDEQRDVQTEAIQSYSIQDQSKASINGRARSRARVYYFSYLQHTAYFKYNINRWG